MASPKTKLASGQHEAFNRFHIGGMGRQSGDFAPKDEFAIFAQRQCDQLECELLLPKQAQTKIARDSFAAKARICYHAADRLDIGEGLWPSQLHRSRVWDRHADIVALLRRNETEVLTLIAIKVPRAVREG